MAEISVLMPVYNTPEIYLKMAIESILKQTFQDFEFLILDDGSDEKTKNIIEYYVALDHRIRVLHHKTNQGCPKSRNDLLENAKAPFVAYQDSDDFSYPNRLEVQYNYLKKHEDISILCAYFKRSDTKNQVVKFPKIIKYMDIINDNCISNNTVMMRLEEINKYGLKYNENFSTSEDYEFWSRAIKNLKIETCEEALLEYTIRNESLSHSNRAVLREKDLQIKENLLNFLTNDEKLQKGIVMLIEKNKKLPFLQKIFSIRSLCALGKKFKIVRVLGLVFDICVDKFN